MNILKFARLLKYFFRIGILLAVLAWALSGYSKFRLAKDGELCAAWGAGVAENASALARAKGRAECVHSRANPLERFFFSNTYETLNALPNAPCKYVGVWTRTAPGNVYKYMLDDAGNFSATRITEGRDDGATRYTGSWGYWRGRFVWFVNDHEQWPPDVNPVISEDADRLTLREHDGSVSQFTRLNAVESKACGTSGVSVAEVNTTATDTDTSTPPTAPADTIDTSGLLQKR